MIVFFDNINHLDWVGGNADKYGEHEFEQDTSIRYIEDVIWSSEWHNSDRYL